jgi:hypothetical protein
MTTDAANDKLTAVWGGCGELDREIKAVEEAAKDWGVHADQLEGRFVSALLAAIRAAGQTNIAAIKDFAKLVQTSKDASDADCKKLADLLAGAKDVTAGAREAVRLSKMAQDQTIFETDKAVSRVAENMAVQLLSKSQKWLVLKQTEYNRKFAWRMGFTIAGVALVLISSGYQARVWQDAPAREAFARCADNAIWVQIGAAARPQPACRLEYLTPRDIADLPNSATNWFTGLFR